MPFLKKFLLFFLGICLFSFFFSNQTYASDFVTTYDVTYNVLTSGITHVTFNINLTNTSSDYYASSYKIQVGFNNIRAITARDPDGPITPSVINTSEGKQIGLIFNKHVVGKDNTLHFTLDFDTTDIAQKVGTIWEVNIPGLTKQYDFSNFTAHVRVPSSFGSASYIKPKQPNNNLDFNKDQLGNAGISLAFGNKQQYNYDLFYHLQNNNIFPTQTEIALPPDTNYQKVLVNSISPKPNNVRLDNDGNWLASFTLKPRQTLKVEAKGDIIVYLLPKQQPITQDEAKLYLEKQPYWQTTDANIQKLAHQLKTPQSIYNYVVSNLHYDFSRITKSESRLGASAVLQQPNSAVCLEFTDLFVALARAAGIPAREVDGYAYTHDTQQRPISDIEDILHAWPEYYDQQQKTWIMVDPTWGNTTGGTDYFNTLDFDHVAFVLKGLDSSYPIPAGGYKLASDKQTKDVNMGFVDTPLQQTNNTTATLNLSNSFLSGFPVNGSVTIQNKSNREIGSNSIEVTVTKLSPTTQTLLTGDIPPYGSITVPFSFAKTSFLTNYTDIVTIHTGKQTIFQKITISPFTKNELKILLGGLFIAILIITVPITAKRTRRLLVSR